MALCATTALAGAVPRLCVRGARGRFGGDAIGDEVEAAYTRHTDAFPWGAGHGTLR